MFQFHKKTILLKKIITGFKPEEELYALDRTENETFFSFCAGNL